MKFSYAIIQELIPTAKNKSDLVESLTMKAFETEHVSSATFNAEIPHNRYGDAASHVGVAREYAAISGKKLKEPEIKRVFFGDKEGIENLSIKINNAKLCPRYGGAYFELAGRGNTPAWMKKALKDCGIKSIHPVVDILNYVMLEVGQPLHAFDADKLKGGIIVRNAKDGERITTIDDQKFKLDKNTLVIADEKKAQAIAGIKGGKDSEVDNKTKSILVEAANFDSASVYKTSRSLNISTDASTRFAHGMSPHSVEIGLGRTRVLLEELIGAKFVGAIDVYPKPVGKEIIGFNIEKFNSITGLSMGKEKITSRLTSLGFKTLPRKSKKDDFIVEVPPLRTDVTMFEDVVEEVVRLYGMDELNPVAPVLTMTQAREEDSIILKDKVRHLLTAAGFTEIYSYSFLNERDKTSYELVNPIAENKKYLRQDLSVGLGDALDTNSRFFDDIKVFEIGDVFDREKGERVFLGIAAKSIYEDPFLALKGVVEKLLHRTGLVEFLLSPKGVDLEIKSDSDTIGTLGISGKNMALAQLDLGLLEKLVEGEYEYQDFPKYPAIMRDISVKMQNITRISEILNVIEEAGAKHMRDVDLIDYYDSKTFTFRVIFQSEVRTLKDKEVNEELKKILSELKETFKLEIR